MSRTERPREWSRRVWCGVALFTLLATTPLLRAQTGSAGGTIPIPSRVADAELLKVENETFSVRDIARAYGKTPGKDSLSFYALDEDSAMAFVNLYADFRLKVHEGRARGLDTREEFVREMANNRNNVALGIGALGSISGDGYLFQREVVDRGINDIWKRRTHEYKVAVIFSAMNPDNPADTMRALKRSIDMLKAINNGADFGRIASDSTNDQQSRLKKGVLGWVTGGMLPRDMEDAIVETEPGNVYPGVVRLPAGFALIQVLDRDDRRRVRIAHIAFEVTRTLDGGNTADEARKRAEEALSRLNKGESFESVAREMSDDRTSAEHGGDLLAWYTRSLGFESRPGKLPPEFEDALFALEPGEYSGIIEDPSLGLRIVKMLQSEEITFEEEEDALRMIYRRNFFDRDRQSFIESVMSERRFSIDPASLEGLLRSIDTTRSAADENWGAGVPESTRSRTLFRLGGLGMEWSVNDWMEEINSNPRFRGLPLSRRSVTTSIRSIAEFPALADEASDLEERYPDFQRLMNDFRDGALIFTMEQDEVYSKVRYEEEAGRKYYEKNRKNYLSPIEVQVSEIFSFTEQAARKVYTRITERGLDLREIAAVETERTGFRQKKGLWGMMSAKDSELVRSLLENEESPEVGKVYGPYKMGQGWSVIRVEAINEPRQLDYTEARAEVMGDYNDWKERELRRTFLDSLRKKFRVEVKKDALENALELR